MRLISGRWPGTSWTGCAFTPSPSCPSSWLTWEPCPTCTSGGWASPARPTSWPSPWTSGGRPRRGAAAGSRHLAGSPVRFPGCSAMSCCAPRWPVSRPAGRRTHCGTSSSCCARTASCTCSDMTTPTPMSMPPCSACKTSCSARGGRSAGQAATGRGRKGQGDASMAWLVVAAIVLALLAGFCASAEVALVRASRAGAHGRAPNGDRDAFSRLQAILAEPSRYLSILLLVRVACETSATLLMAAALLHWLGYGWRTFLIIAVIMIAILYLVAGIGPRTLGRQHERRVALATARVLYPLVRMLGPLPRLLLAAGSVLTPGRGARRSEEHTSE